MTDTNSEHVRGIDSLRPSCVGHRAGVFPEPHAAAHDIDADGLAVQPRDVMVSLILLPGFQGPLRVRLGSDAFRHDLTSFQCRPLYRITLDHGGDDFDCGSSSNDGTVLRGGGRSSSTSGISLDGGEGCALTAGRNGVVEGACGFLAR